MTQPAHRDSIYNEQAEILGHEHLAGDQHILRLHAPECAARARSGQFVHVQVDPQRPLRRPISLLRFAPDQGWIELLYKVVGEGTALLARRPAGEALDILGPIGRPFDLPPALGKERALLIGGGVGMPPMIALAETLRRSGLPLPLVILGSEVPFAFDPRPSQILLPGLPAEAIAAMPLLDDWGIPSRLASLQGFAGCFLGYVTELARHWLKTLDAATQAGLVLYACGPQPMLKAVAALAVEFDLACQVSLEEHMACGIGGCAGCTVPVQTEHGLAMKRVCVDGPVFDARAVFT
ncbi:MAG: dihydroorotate dehydrogenase electron transfer subunit [Gammaproteobacteria bacterium SHHR-1]|uniref:dihydroorotate dehydrogenase electron transfer subunit n=1 Tax=Magnetovirga frankeli TaxID=947516 RepID=UPI0012940F04|nr:dihydroorotate dehydrogenase electron transfer subunit [gamma proteobacterium SS-5]